ncbi:helix-turn-helix transcriptional regulator [Loigolactobacillus coryniformis]|uniref:helix-turn-helix domain-containing protein n=1 Tax=Loigolactobacillus coryniformis TaxID=1610 RepID=UPI002340C949|nr:helix-turn-helix transcriptional regulator [Loigolactobacillus coryniformis]MDC4187131.1 helix-turn-helix transcriptional regulator [Loigolactobacillus coryniformis]
MQITNQPIDLTDIAAVEAKRREIAHIIETYPRDSHEFRTATAANNELLDSNVPIRIFYLIGHHLDHPITEHEIAQLIVAGAKGEDLSEVLPLTPEVKTAIKFQIARRQAKMTQAEVAAKVGHISQAQIAKAERAQTSLSINRWAELFKVVGTSAVIKLY